MKKITIATCVFLLLFAGNQSFGQNFSWAGSMGGANTDKGYSITTDAAGNTYTTGYFTGTADFDPGAGVLNITSIGATDIFIQKTGPSGDLIWVKNIGGAALSCGAYDIASDNQNNIYVTGYFGGTVDFDPGAGTSTLTSHGSEDVFLLKLDDSGNFLWANAMGGNKSDIGLSVATDPSGDVFITGYFDGTGDFDPGAGVYNLTSAGFIDIFVQKTDASGNLLWAVSIGGTGFEEGHAMATDGLGNVFVTGYFEKTVDFDPGAGGFPLTTNGGADVYILKLDPAGSLLWATSFGSGSDDGGLSIATDLHGNVYTTGFFAGIADFDPGAGTVNLTTKGSIDIFVQKSDPSGNFLWANSTGSTSSDSGEGVTTDAEGNMYLVGYFRQTVDFDPGPDTASFTAVGSLDIFVQKLDSAGNLLWVKTLGGTSGEVAEAVAVDMMGNVYVTGHYTETVDFDPGAGTASHTSMGSNDIFILKLGEVADKITDNLWLHNFQLYPNPSTGKIRISSTENLVEAGVNVLDISGKLIQHQTFRNTAEMELNLRVPAGIYFIEITAAQGRAVLVANVIE
ncbi:MAG: T9SS type A sorting domain-containing protein [Bacteroidia bacterium]